MGHMARTPDHPADVPLRANTAPEPPDRMTQRVLAVCDAVGAYIEAWGFRAIHGRVWSLLALSGAPMAQAEVAEILGVSRSMVSLAVAELTQYGLVRAQGSSRNAPYEACLDVWPTITDVIRGREWMLIERARLALEAALHEAEFARDARVEVPWDLNRIKLLLRMTEFAQSVLRAVLSIRMPRSLDAFGRWLQQSAGYVERLQKMWPL